MFFKKFLKIMSLFALGTIAFDSIETPFNRVDRIIGGSCNYIAWAANHLVDKVLVSAVIGQDYPVEEIEALKTRGVCFDGLEILNGKSFFWSGRYHLNFNQRDTLKTELNVLEQFQPVLPKSYQRVEFVLLGNLTPKVQLDVLSQFKNRPSFTALDTMNFWIENEATQGSLYEVLKRIDLLMINDEEARLLGRAHSLVECARSIRSNFGISFLIIKKGEHGALLFYENELFYAPALPLANVCDPTGAGDSFAGGLMGYLAQTKEISFNNMKRAILYGSVMASFCVEEFGPNRLKTIQQSDIQQRLQAFRKIIQVDF